MARKRGGLAGMYDRNKGWLRYVAPAVVGAIPGLGPLAAAGLGAAMGGDTEGKGYFKGFNTRGAIRGGLEGYSMGNLGKSAKEGAKKGISKLLAPKADAALPSLPERTFGVTNTMLPNASVSPVAANFGAGDFASIGNAAAADDIGSLARTSSAMPTRSISAPSIGSVGRTSPSAISSSAPSMLSQASETIPQKVAATVSGGAKEPGRITRGMDWLAKYEKPLSTLTTGIMSAIPSELDAQTIDLNERRFNEEMRRQRMQEERFANMAQLLVPLLRQQMAQPQPRTLAEYLQGR